MINNSLLLRTAGNHPLIQVRERSAWVRDFPDVPRSCLDASGIPDWWKADICVREIATGVGLVVGSSTAGKSSCAPPVHHEGDPRVLLRIEAQSVRRQPRLRSAIDTSAATALSGTLKPALRRPLGVSTNTRRRRDIRLTIANGLERSPARNRPSRCNGNRRRPSPRD